MSAGLAGFKVVISPFVEDRVERFIVEEGAFRLRLWLWMAASCLQIRNRQSVIRKYRRKVLA